MTVSTASGLRQKRSTPAGTKKAPTQGEPGFKGTGNTKRPSASPVFSPQNPFHDSEGGATKKKRIQREIHHVRYTSAERLFPWSAANGGYRIAGERSHGAVYVGIWGVAKRRDDCEQQKAE